MSKHKNKIIVGIVIAIILAFVFWYGGDAPGLRGWTPELKETASVVQNDEPTKEEINITSVNDINKFYIRNKLCYNIDA